MATNFWTQLTNLAPVKDNCALFAPIPYFRARAFRRCHLNLSPADPTAHLLINESWLSGVVTVEERRYGPTTTRLPDVT